MVKDLLKQSGKKQKNPNSNPLIRHWTKQQIGVHREIVEQFRKWQIHPATFFQNDQSQALPTTIRRLCEAIRDLSSETIVSRIRLRFFWFTLHKFRSLEPGHDGIKWVRLLFTDEVMIESVTRWVFYGKRLSTVASYFGGTGCFFLLPTDSSDIASVIHTHLAQVLTDLLPGGSSDLHLAIFLNYQNFMTSRLL